MLDLKIGKDVAFWNDLLKKLEKYNPKHSGFGSMIIISKKNTFRIEIGITSYSGGGFQIWGNIHKRTPFGGYKNVGSLDTHNFLSKIDECLTWPEVEKTEKKFNKNQLIQNVVGREIMSKLSCKGKIQKLAVDDGDCCKMSSYSFQCCEVYQDKIRVTWRSPNGCYESKSITFDMMHPSFNPNLLTRLIAKFSSEVSYLESSLKSAWGDIEHEWYMEKKK